MGPAKGRLRLAAVCVLACQLACHLLAAAQTLDVERDQSLSLASILEHQQAIELECAKYRTRQEGQLAGLAELADQLQLARPLTVKVPAVCLLLAASVASEPGDQELPSSRRPDLVNWLVPVDELAARRQDNITKRQVGAEEPELLNELLLDPLAPGHFAGEPEESELERQLHQVTQDARFGPTIASQRAKLAGKLSPVVLVPGLLGSRLQARTNKLTRVNIFCAKQSDWQDMWLSLRQLLPLAVDCWLDNVRLEVDPSSGFTRQPAGVEARVPDFGSLASVRHLDLRQPKLSAYFAPLIEHYLQLGYLADQNLLAAPYDFRLAPQQLQDYFLQLRQLIEAAQTRSNQPVTLVCHSMGCTHLLIFLRLQGAAWRQVRIRKLVAISSPWGGAVKALKALVVGDQLDLPLVSEAKMRKLARTYPSIAFLLPQPEVFGRAQGSLSSEPGGPALVQTPARAYKVGQLAELLQDLNLTQQLTWFKDTASLIKPLEPLQDLAVDCIHSLNTPTPETLIFSQQANFPNGDYQLVRGDGDGTVNAQSLLVCADWARQLPDKVTHKVIMSADHMGVLSHKATLAHLTNDVFLG